MPGAREGPSTVKFKVLLVADETLWREGMHHILHADGRFEVVDQVTSSTEALSSVNSAIDLVIVNLSRPGVTTAASLRELQIHTGGRIVAMVQAGGASHPSAEVASIVDGFIHMDSNPAEFCEAVAAVGRGERLASLGVLPGPDPDDGGAAFRLLRGLTAREREILSALASASSNREIAGSLGISPMTLRNHISNIYHKLEIYDRAQAVMVAVQGGLVGGDRVDSL